MTSRVLVSALAGFILILALGRLAVVDGQGETRIHLVTLSRIGGESRAVAVDQGRAVLAEGDSILVVDVADPDHLVVTGRVGGFARVGGPIRDIAIVGDTAYVASPVGLSVVDISDVYAPRVASVAPIGSAYAVDVEGDRLYAVGATGTPWSAYGGTLHVFDVSGASAPVELGSLNGVTGWWGLSVADRVVWLPGGSHGLVAVDASDPVSMTVVSNTGAESGLRSPMCAAADRDRSRLYVVGLEPSHANTNGMVGTFDVSDPAQPISLGVAARRETAVSDCALGDGDFYIAQGKAVEVHSTDGDGATARKRLVIMRSVAAALDVSDGLMFVAAQVSSTVIGELEYATTGLLVYRDATPLGHVATAGYGSGVAVQGDVAYVAAGQAGLWTYGVADPFQPELLGSADVGHGVAYRVAVDGDVALVAAGRVGVRRYWVSDPSRPAFTGEYHPSGGIVDVRRVAVSEGVGMAVIRPDGPAGVIAYSFTRPREMSQIDARLADVSFDGPMGLAAGNQPTLGYYDLTDSANPVLAGELPPEAMRSVGLDVAPAGPGVTLLLHRVPGSHFIPTPRPTGVGPPTPGASPTPTLAATAPPDGSGLTLVDSSDLSALRALSTVTDPNRQDILVHHRGVAYLGPYVTHAYAVSDPSAPHAMRALLDGTPGALRMADGVGAGDLLFVASGSEGVRIVRPMRQDDPTPTATSTARQPGTLPPPLFTMTAEAGATMTASAGGTMTAETGTSPTTSPSPTPGTPTPGTPDVPINWQLYVPAAMAHD